MKTTTAQVPGRISAGVGIKGERRLWPTAEPAIPDDLPRAWLTLCRYCGYAPAGAACPERCPKCFGSAWERRASRWSRLREAAARQQRQRCLGTATNLMLTAACAAVVAERQARPAGENGASPEPLDQ